MIFGMRQNVNIVVKQEHVYNEVRFEQAPLLNSVHSQSPIWEEKQRKDIIVIAPKICNDRR